MPATTQAPTTTQLAALIGQTRNITTDIGLVACEITDAKFAFGNTRVCVRPIVGASPHGVDLAGKWVDASRVSNTTISVSTHGAGLFRA